MEEVEEKLDLAIAALNLGGRTEEILKVYSDVSNKSKKGNNGSNCIISW